MKLYEVDMTPVPGKEFLDMKVSSELQRISCVASGVASLEYEGSKKYITMREFVMIAFIALAKGMDLVGGMQEVTFVLARQAIDAVHLTVDQVAAHLKAMLAGKVGREDFTANYVRDMDFTTVGGSDVSGLQDKDFEVVASHVRDELLRRLPQEMQGNGELDMLRFLPMLIMGINGPAGYMSGFGGMFPFHDEDLFMRALVGMPLLGKWSGMSEEDEWIIDHLNLLGVKVWAFYHGPKGLLDIQAKEWAKEAGLSSPAGGVLFVRSKRYVRQLDAELHGDGISGAGGKRRQADTAAANWEVVVQTPGTVRLRKNVGCLNNCRLCSA